MQDAPEPEPSSSSSGKRTAKTQENAPGSGIQECSICGTSKSSSSVMDLSANNVMQRRLSRDWKLPADIINTTLQAICVECVCKLNMHSEVTRTLMQRLQRLTKASGTAAEAERQSKQCSPPIADAEVSTTGGPLPLEDVADAADVASATTSSSCSVLQAYSAQPPESPTATESGGMHNNNGNALDGWKWRTRLVCQHCERAYFRKDLYTLHVRRCWRRSTQRHHKCRVLNEASIDDNGDAEEDYNDQTLTQAPRHSRTFQCKHCVKEFAGIVALRQHQRTTHQSHHRCSLCEAEFGTKYEWELHHTICSAKQEAVQGQEVTATRSTRSRSRACSLAWYKDNEDEADDEEKGEQDDDATSVADTMYTRRMNFTGDWIVNHSRSNSNSAINLTMLYDDYVLEESQITTDKEYDLYLLDLLKTQVQLKAFSCFVPNCCYQTDTLVDLMKHDYMQHWKMSWFYCHKCGDVFTSKVFLDYHLHRQNRGFYICHKCHDEFEFQHQLDRHQVLHSKGINYHCNFCRLEFLSEAKLLAHCEHERHSPNDEPPLICIDHALSISNPVPKEPNKVRQYTMRVLDIPHIPWHSNRPMHLPQHKPFRFAIGICDFDNRNPPNCVGCM
ncbi:zinc finger protein 33A [Drosophila innubila]|uniref:zinc finger protein 33A n=1 Tax=Drosophila innubila TaxID=198719 RepID=UPI00148E3E21|nr:zinc finger protein 33A [Drosophila innubila]